MINLQKTMENENGFRIRTYTKKNWHACIAPMLRRAALFVH